MSDPIANDLVQMSLIGEAVDAGPIAIFVADDDRRYLAVNAYACTLLGYSREELLDLGVLDVAINPDAAHDYEEMLASGFSVGTARLRCKSGTELAIGYRAVRTEVGSMRLYVSACWPLDES